MALEGSAATVVSLWVLLAGSFPAWFLIGPQALFDMWPKERGLFCLVARPVPMGDAEVSQTLLGHPVLAAVHLALRGPFCPPVPCSSSPGL